MKNKATKREQNIKILLDLKAGRMKLSDLRKAGTFQITMNLGGVPLTPEQVAANDKKDREARAKGDTVYRITLNL